MAAKNHDWMQREKHFFREISFSIPKQPLLLSYLCNNQVDVQVIVSHCVKSKANYTVLDARVT